MRLRRPPPTEPVALPTEALAAALAADSTTDDGLVCEWGPIEGQDGVWQLMCYREGDTGDTVGSDGVICWYLVTYDCTRTPCRKIAEVFLGCESEGGEDCDETQWEIYREYNNEGVHGTHGMRPQESPSSCEVIEHHPDRYRPTPHFTWSELNDGFSEGNPHSGNGGGWGWIQAGLTQSLERLRADWGQQAMSSDSIYGKAIPLSSGYRCPHGNASIPGASSTSWHMSGRAADVSVKSMAGVWNNWSGMSDEEKARVQEIWEMLDHLTREGSLNANMDPQPFTAYRDRHFHAAW